jgi:hypothetical protein
MRVAQVSETNGVYKITLRPGCALGRGTLAQRTVL